MTGGVWVASFVVLWAAVAVLLLMVLALVRQIGVLHARLDEVSDRVDERLDGSGVGAGVGAGDGAEGPALGEPAPLPGRIAYGRAPMTLVAFTSPACELSQALAPALRAIDRQYAELRVLDLPLGPRTMSAFEAFNVSATPFVVAVDREGCVRGRGRARNLAQLDELVVRAAGAARAAAAERRAGAGGAGGPVNGKNPPAAHAAPPTSSPPPSSPSPPPSSDSPPPSSPSPPPSSDSPPPSSDSPDRPPFSAPSVAPDATHGAENRDVAVGPSPVDAGDIVAEAVETDAGSEAAPPPVPASEHVDAAQVAGEAVVADLGGDPQLGSEADPARVGA